MINKQGFSLVEIIVALVIVGITSMIIIPNVMVSMEQSKASAARNNLLAIAAAQEKYFEDNNAYSTTSGATLLSALRLTIQSGDPFTYSCTNPPAPYGCTASDTSVSPTVTWTLLNNAAGTGVTLNCTSGGRYCPS